MASIRSITEGPTTARCDGATLVLGYFVEDDPAVLRVLSVADDVGEATHTCLQVGARALLAGHAALDEVLVGRSFDQLVERLNISVDAGVERIAGTATALLGEEDGAPTEMLADVKGELTARLEALFDPDSKSSALALIEEILGTATTASVARLQASLDLENPESPLGRWRAEFAQLVKEHDGETLREVRELATALAVEDAKAEVWQLTALKGIAYEEVVHLAFSEVVACHGDIIEDVGRQRGASGAMVGDLVITLNAEEFGGRSPVVVLDAKNRKLSLRKTLEELDAAMVNREADVGIAIFSSRDHVKTPSVFVPYGNRAVMVLDDDCPDLGVVELADAWARTVLRRSAGPEAADFDHERLADAVAKVTRALDRVSTIRKCHGTVLRQVDLASAELTDLVNESRDAIAEIKELGIA